jgi:hypothetical protein
MRHTALANVYRAIVLLVCLTAVCPALAQSSQPLPRLEGENFAGHKVLLPGDAAGKVTILVFGFSHASSKPTGAWADKLAAEFGSQPGFDLYQLPVLEDVPRLIRGMVVSGIKKSVPDSKRDHFVPLFQGEDQLKKTVNFTASDDAYIVLLDRAGKIVQQAHGPVDDAHYAPIRAQIKSLLDQK